MIAAIPLEIVGRICDITPDVRPLTLSCKHLHNGMYDHNDSKYWRGGPDMYRHLNVKIYNELGCADIERVVECDNVEIFNLHRKNVPNNVLDENGMHDMICKYGAIGILLTGNGVATTSRGTPDEPKEVTECKNDAETSTADKNADTKKGKTREELARELFADTASKIVGPAERFVKSYRIMATILNAGIKVAPPEDKIEGMFLYLNAAGFETLSAEIGGLPPTLARDAIRSIPQNNRGYGNWRHKHMDEIVKMIPVLVRKYKQRLDTDAAQCYAEHAQKSGHLEAALFLREYVPE